jgi:hypothetical protein
MKKFDSIVTVGDNIQVEALQGAGGKFLASVLHSCLTGDEWQPKKDAVNFHYVPDNQMVLMTHHSKKSTSVLGLDSRRARYNFWLYYWHKRVCYELELYRVNGRRWPWWSKDIKDPRSDGCMLLDNCSHINSFHSDQDLILDWVEMIQSPERSWMIIQEFFFINKCQNRWNKDQWVSAVDTYRSTLKIKKQHINIKHTYWQIWMLSVLQQQGIQPNFGLIKNWGTPLLHDWLIQYQDSVIEYTKNHYTSIG